MSTLALVVTQHKFMCEMQFLTVQLHFKCEMQHDLKDK